MQLKTVEEQNRAFNKMNKRHQAVAIAKDVIAQLQLGKLKAQKGSYIRIKDNGPYPAFDDIIHVNVPKPDSAQEFLLNNICQVCVKGAILACAIKRKNKVKTDQIPGNYSKAWVGTEIAPLLGNIFTPEELRLMEVEFEFTDYENHWHLDTQRKPQMLEMIDLTPDERMIRIMRNIIKNKGYFMPDKD